MSAKDLLGLTFLVNRRWLQLRVIYGQNTVDGVGQTLGPIYTNIKNTYYGASAGLDFGSFFFVGETSLLGFDKDINTNFTWLVSGGVRFGKFTPHITYSACEEDDDNLPAMVKQNTTTAGVRYDFHPNAAMKLEYSIRKDESEGTVFYGDADLISFAIDYCF